ncbi:EAL domain-containing protein [Gynuella sunshinyii]|uniref:Putative signal transduction protein containing a membrane domain, an EAL and a GGDEF domain n=1 Tax=Gynuella sunshinyii YC6258 TaxID=1445510 RepID=A0A0C5V3S5_9GAMM|nr:EAL domain-containing protein [Gynuella sunshinyii]AJQ94145.1 putative signal transduction protein containing a membrane domain, an EAL and a GGDEF domain [Gynuella sunshinyii YC6258]
MRDWLQYFSTRIRYKLFAAALVAALFIGLTGAVSLRAIEILVSSVNVTNEVSLPFLSHTMDATHAMRELTVTTDNFFSNCDTADSAFLLSVKSSLEKNIITVDALTVFLNRAQLLEYATSIHQLRNRLHQALTDMLQSCETQASLQRQLQQQQQLVLAGIEVLERNFDQGITDLTFQLEQKPYESVILHENYTSLWPILSSLVRLKVYTRRIHDSILKLVSWGSGDEINQRFTDYQGLITQLKNETQQTEHLLKQVDDRVTDIKTAEPLVTLMLPVQDIQDIWQKKMAVRDAMQVNQIAADSARLVMISKLHTLESKARDAYVDTNTSNNRIVIEVSWMLAIVASIASVILLLSGWFVFRRLLQPLELLKQHVNNAMTNGELSRSMPERLTERRDEVGALAVSFEKLIADLSLTGSETLIGSQAEINKQYERLATAIESIPQGICLVDATDCVLICNRHFKFIYCLTDGQIREGMPICDVVAACQENGAVFNICQQEKSEGSTPVGFSFSQQMVNFRDEKIIVVRTAETPEGGRVFIHEDVTERRRQEERIAYLAHHDALTGLANRTLFRIEFKDVLDTLADGQQVALLYLDLDCFKIVNDTMGHPIGDRLLIQVADRLRVCLRDSDKVCRFGGDEFAVLLTQNSNQESAVMISERIIQTVSQPYDIEGQSIHIGISIGIAVAPVNGTDPDRLIKCADVALYRAKQKGRKTYCFFELEMDAQIQSQRALELDLRMAVEQQQLELYYQPQVNTLNHQIACFEALLRWHHSERGPVAPAEFIPVAEDTGLIIPIGSWVLRRACQDARKWPENVCVSVNVSPVQFRTESLLADVKSALSTSGLTPQRLELEITEAILLHDTLNTLTTLTQISQMGVQISMDDFGTGYASLSYIQKFKFDKVKIDRSFVSDLVCSKDNQAMVHALCRLCISLGIGTVAEGVENLRQLRLLEQEGCTNMQGYYFARPMPADQAAIAIEKQTHYIRFDNS